MSKLVKMATSKSNMAAFSVVDQKNFNLDKLLVHFSKKSRISWLFQTFRINTWS